MKLFDSHCHLDDEAYAEDLDEVISAGTVVKRSFFDLINAGDEIIPVVSTAESPQSEDFGEPGLLRRLLNFVGL